MTSIGSSTLFSKLNANCNGTAKALCKIRRDASLERYRHFDALEASAAERPIEPTIAAKLDHRGCPLGRCALGLVESSRRHVVASTAGIRQLIDVTRPHGEIWVGFSVGEFQETHTLSSPRPPPLGSDDAGQQDILAEQRSAISMHEINAFRHLRRWLRQHPTHAIGRNRAFSSNLRNTHHHGRVKNRESLKAQSFCCGHFGRVRVE